MTKFKNYVTKEIGDFLWDGFTDPASVGVNLFNLLDGAALVGVDLTDEQKNSVLAHVNEIDGWTSTDEEVRDLIAAATDMQDYEKMFDWLSFVVGDTTAAGLVKGWAVEAQAMLDHFDRVNGAHTLTVGEWLAYYQEEAAETTDPEERDAIRAAASLLDGEDPEALAINYVATDPVDFTILPYGATTKAEQRLCKDLALI